MGWGVREEGKRGEQEQIDYLAAQRPRDQESKRASRDPGDPTGHTAIKESEKQREGMPMD